MSPLVSVEWLQQHLAEPHLIILDASVSKIVGIEPIEYSEFCCIPGSQFCDIAGSFHLSSSPLSHTMPTDKQFSLQAQALGISSQSKIVIYDNQGMYSAPRAWWMFKAMGIQNVFVLNGGLPLWLRQGYKTDSDYQVTENKGSVTGTLQQGSVVTSQQVLAAINKPDQQIVDARSFSRFCGTAKEPRAGLRSGHIPNSINLHFASLLENGCYKSTTKLTEIFSQAKLSKANQLIGSCGSGMTACIVLLAAYILGYRNLSLYDGSWSEWGADDSLPLAKIEFKKP